MANFHNLQRKLETATLMHKSLHDQNLLYESM